MDNKVQISVETPVKPAYQLLCIKRGNPIIPTEREQIDVDKYERLCNEIVKVNGLSKLTLEPARLVVERDGTKKSFRYTSDVSLDWVLTKLGLIEVKKPAKRKTRAEIEAENVRLLEAIKQRGIKV